ncbi:MAG: type I methionyl aminopeptidase [Candidatus Aminicenantia bacterium]
MIEIKTKEELKRMKKAGEIVAIVLAELEKYIKPGITTLKLDEIAENLVRKMGGIPAFKGYKPHPFFPREFPSTICVSINEEIVHGIPSKRILREGDIVSIDIGVRVDGFYSDSAWTFPVGEITEKAKRLLDITMNALFIAIEKVRSGVKVGDISFAIQNYVETNGFSVIRDFVGHGIGRNLHEEPQIPNFGVPGKGSELREGVVIAIEPMVSSGSFEVEILNDTWTAVTKDRSLSAHFEHSVAITSDGPWILTILEGGHA